MLLVLARAADQPIERIVVSGSLQHVTQTQVEDVVRAELRGAGLVTVNLTRISRGLDALPWVDRATVQRSWPRGLTIQITEQITVARWNGTGLLNARGDLFLQHVLVAPADMPQLAGPDGSQQEVTARYLAMQQRLSGLGLTLSTLMLDERGAWNFALSDGVAVRLGRSDVDARFDRFTLAAAGTGAHGAPRILATSICATAMASRWGGRGRICPQPCRWPGQEITPILMAKKKSDRDVIVGLDIGTSKVLALVGEITPEGAIEIIGMGSQPSRGLKKGVVVNIESTVQSIQRAVEEAELMADCEINAVYAGIAGSHVRSLNSHGVVAIRDREVTAADVEQVIEAAKAVAYSGGSANPARTAAGIHHRWAGGDPRSHRNVGSTPGGQDPYRHRRRQARRRTSSSACSAAA